MIITTSRSALLVFIFIGLATSVTVRGESVDCDRLSGNQNMLCVAMARCSRLDAPDARSGCVTAVLQATGNVPVTAAEQPLAPVAKARLPSPPERPVRPTSPPAKPVAPSPVQQQVVETVPVQPQPVVADVAPTQATVVNTRSEPKSDTTPEKRTDNTIQFQTGDRVTVPTTFESAIDMARELVRDRQLVLLQNGLVFEGEGPEYDAGESVRVVKRGRFGDRFTITSSRGRPREFRRVNCELLADEMNKDTARKCRMLMSR